MKLKRMSVHDFKAYIKAKEKEIEGIYYDSTEQSTYDPGDSIQLKLRFDGIEIYENPDYLYLFTEDKRTAVMSFPNIKEIVFLRKASVEHGEAVRIVSNSYTGAYAREAEIRIEYRA